MTPELIIFILLGIIIVLLQSYIRLKDKHDKLKINHDYMAAHLLEIYKSLRRIKKTSQAVQSPRISPKSKSKRKKSKVK